MSKESTSIVSIGRSPIAFFVLMLICALAFAATYTLSIFATANYSENETNEALVYQYQNQVLPKAKWPTYLPRIGDYVIATFVKSSVQGTFQKLDNTTAGYHQIGKLKLAEPPCAGDLP
jgi:hypothetical protein